jgi:ABC-type bacteriocin/lantibiotic exporter with double-glycine peptidase domain
MVRLGSNNSVREILTSTALSAFMDGTMASFYLILLLLASPPLTLMVTVLAGARFGLLAIVRWRQRQFLAESLENSAQSSTAQVEMLTSMETLKAMGLEHRAAENWSNVFVDGLNISIKRGRLDAIFDAMLSLLGMVSSLALMFYGAYLVLQGTFTLGIMMAYTALAGGFLGPLNNLVSSALQLQMLEVYLERLNDVMDTPPEQDNNAVTPAGQLAGAIALESVSFRYGKQAPLVLDDVSIEVAPGARVALVGRTGSGKSTLARLMAGLYEPGSGRILFDGKDLKTLDRRSVRSQLGIVTQETQLFGGSIRRNIAIADPRMGLNRVVQAAKLGCIHDEIVAMPLGYETPLADRGLSLSGGQRQRLTIARALVTNPRILILDEATSHLDSVTEENVNRNLASQRCTRVVIAHRLSTIRDADMILVLDGGRIVQKGTHEELLRAGGVYADLTNAQRDQEPETERV